MKAALVDFHCHLDLFPDLASAISAAETAGIYTLTVTTTPRAWPRNYDLTRKTKYIRAALGLHPQLVAERSAEIKLWEEYLPHARYVGEVGIDAGPQYYRSVDLQKEIFATILRKCAETGGKVLTVHSVRAATAVLDLIESHLPRHRGQVVLHWFTGSKSEARRAADLGCYFSVNAAMMRNERGCGLVAALPSDRLLTETDAPFTRADNRSTSPSDVKATVEALAALRRETPENMAHMISSNLRAVLGDAGAPLDD
ncbi:MAG: hydrolase TatD [Acidobacteria bacterium]|nr:MAG: hydrolase TatD [Acidobacteriota bacterium]